MNQNSPNREYLFRRRDGARTSLPTRMQDEVCYAAVECWRACNERCVVDDDNASTLTAATHDPCHPTTPPSQLHCLHLLTRVVVDTQRRERDEKLLLITLSLTYLPLPPRRPLRSQPGVSDGDSPVSRRQQITFRASSSSTSSMDYSLPRLRTKFGERAFSHARPATWKALPDHIRTVADPVKFRKLLKSHNFSQPFNIC